MSYDPHAVKTAHVAFILIKNPLCLPSIVILKYCTTITLPWAQRHIQRGSFLALRVISSNSKSKARIKPNSSVRTSLPTSSSSPSTSEHDSSKERLKLGLNRSVFVTGMLALSLTRRAMGLPGYPRASSLTPTIRYIGPRNQQLAIIVRTPSVALRQQAHGPLARGNVVHARWMLTPSIPCRVRFTRASPCTRQASITTTMATLQALRVQ